MAESRSNGPGMDRCITFFIILYAVTALLRIPVSAVIGSEGIAYAGPAVELAGLCYAVIAGSACSTLRSLIKTRMRKGRYRSISVLFHSSFTLSLLLGIAAACAFFFGCHLLAGTAGDRSEMYLVFAAASLNVFFLSVIGTLQGYFEGVRISMPVSSTNLLQAALNAVLTIVGGSLFYRYGERVAALLQNEAYAPVWGAVGMMAGFDLASLISLLYIIFLYLNTRKALRARFEFEDRFEQMTEQKSYLIRTYTVNYLMAAAAMIFITLPVVTDYRIYMSSGQASLSDWGWFYGRTLALVSAFSALLAIPFTRYHECIAGTYYGTEKRTARSYFGLLMRLSGFLVFPAAFFCLSASNALTSSLNGKLNGTAAMTLQWESAAIVFQTACFLLVQTAFSLKKKKEVIIAAAAAFSLQTVLMNVLAAADTGIAACAVSLLLFWFLLFLFLLLLLKDLTLYSRRWITCWTRILFSSVIAALPVYFLSGILPDAVGNIPACLLLIVLYDVLYLLLSLFTGGCDLRYIDWLPGGRRIQMLAEHLNLY
jgi:stage V sporulation protein B